MVDNCHVDQGGSEYIYIGLVGLVWKLIADIINLQLKVTTNFHDTLHIF